MIITSHFNPYGPPKLPNDDFMQTDFEHPPLRAAYRAALQSTDERQLEETITGMARSSPTASSWEAEVIESIAVLLRVSSSTVAENVTPAMK